MVRGRDGWLQFDRIFDQVFVKHVGGDDSFDTVCDNVEQAFAHIIFADKEGDLPFGDGVDERSYLAEMFRP